MRKLLITIAAVVLTGCIGVSKTELLKDEKGNPIILPIESVTESASKAESPTAKAPDISIHDAAALGNNEAVKQHLSAGTDVMRRMNLDGHHCIGRLQRFTIKLLNCLSRLVRM